MTDNITIRMLITMRPDPEITHIIGQPEDTILEKDHIYPARTGTYGAVSAMALNGQWMGIVHGTEFEFMEAPMWLLRIHGVCL